MVKKIKSLGKRLIASIQAHKKKYALGAALFIAILSAGLWCYHTRHQTTHSSSNPRSSTQEKQSAQQKAKSNTEAKTDSKANTQTNNSPTANAQHNTVPQWGSGPKSHGLFTVVGSLTDVSKDKAAVVLGNNSKLSFSLNLVDSHSSSQQTPGELSGKTVEVSITVMSDGTFTARRIVEVK